MVNGDHDIANLAARRKFEIAQKALEQMQKDLDANVIVMVGFDAGGTYVLSSMPKGSGPMEERASEALAAVFLMKRATR